MLVEVLTSREIAEWEAYLELEPAGPLRDDERAGQIVAALWNQNLRKGQKPFTWQDAMPRLENFMDGPPPKSSRVVRAPVRRAPPKAKE